MATAVAMAPQVRTSTPPPHLTLNTSSRGTPAAVPNKYIPVCSPGPVPARGLDTPPASPPSRNSYIETSSITYPPEACGHQYSLDPPVWTISAAKMAQALEHISTQPLPHPEQVFPWLHGLHAENQMQLAFFVSRRKSVRKVPRCIRGITLVKTGGDLSTSKLKGAIAPEEILANLDGKPGSFIECDPKDGFSVRNFQIQACKMATVSDIIVYGDEDTCPTETIALAQRISAAQRAYEEKNGLQKGLFNTFMLFDPFHHVEKHHPDLVAVDSTGTMTGNIVDFFYWERYEMCAMSQASEISSNVFLGPSPDPTLELSMSSEHSFDVLIETSDMARLPQPKALKAYRASLQAANHPPLHIEFPASGNIEPPTWSHTEVDALMDMCKWIYDIANPSEDGTALQNDSAGDAIMAAATLKPQKVLIHCTDGYTETTLLGLAYFMYAEGLPVHEAWVRLHQEKGRNFFAYQSDAALLACIQPRILQESPRWKKSVFNIPEPKWLSRIDGSLPSRILPYMYLGNLCHANNPELLRELGITRVLSVGETITWQDDVRKRLNWPEENLLSVTGVQDNGVDPLWDEFDRCLKFIERGKLDGTATLVHCRVGVSRSATICIAEVMNEMGLSFPRAYCFVRARRLNVIIQPHLRFTYELLKWEEYQRLKRNEPLRRELEWATVAREIALMNKPYAR
ncbi:dual specificity protein phosphatase-like protein PPS1 [Delitschia confertaspora ATCC 74209]|uniref:Dual specificity protein phosphatase-like protein PPS1 n=1 Tax=Delitschia confertaspora ATCC 74209 TaxID=1513339 RepID=A0A9P4MQA0_9PLEO|nr:dual specificity protein phosphatase-like protein PPS1 [Delitschia confertaspora ATCC 74209]